MLEGEDIENMEADTDDSEESDSEAINEMEVAKITKELKANPNLYDHHIKLIKLLHDMGEFTRLRTAREEMHKVYPLSPELWLDWLIDEKELAFSEEEKQYVINLFELAVKDYPSVCVWLKYIQYIISLNIIPNSEEVRSIFERALTAVGLHVTEGCLIWEKFRDFERLNLATLKDEDEREKQMKRIWHLFRRQLAVPLKHMSQTYSEFQETFPDEKDSSILIGYQQALKKLENRMPYEDALSHSAPPNLEEFKRYIEFEIKEGIPVRIDNLYQRALVDNCLNVELWLDYTKFLDKTIQVSTVVLPAHERAIRNCPWSSQCWTKYAVAMERHQQPENKIIDIYEKALVSGFTQAEEYLDIWLSYSDYMRRRITIKPDDGKIKAAHDVRNVLSRATEHLMANFPDQDFQCTTRQYWTKIEAKYCKDLPRAREIWEDILNHRHKYEAQTWLNYANFERIYGDESTYRSVLYRAALIVSDWPESVGDELVRFEREEGTLESLELAYKSYESLVEKATKRRERIAEKELKEAESRKQAREGKRAAAKASPPPVKKQKFSKESEEFKVPPLPSSSGNKTSSQKPSAEKTVETKSEGKHGESVKHDPYKDDRSVFLSNLSFDIGEKEISEMLSKVGEIEEVRLVKDYRGRSKGYCYVVFKKMADAQNALKKDREPLDGRPVFISKCRDKKFTSDSTEKFKFSTGLEKNKLFIKNLPFSVTEEKLKSMFGEFGALKEVRLVTYRNGHSKGLAYVEYQDEASASAALVKTDGTIIEEHAISVAISNPPKRREKGGAKEFSLPAPANPSLAFGRSKSKTQFLLPRSIQKTQSMPRSSSSASDSNGNSDFKKPLGNEDFRNMFVKK